MARTSGAAPPKRSTASWRVWVKTARPFSLSASVSPVLVGTALAAYDGVFRPAPFIAALVSGMFLQIAANFFNEYFDYRYGLDTAQSLGASTVIFRGEMTARQVYLAGALSFVLAALFGIGLLVLTGPAILLFGVFGMAIAYFYSARPFTFARRGLGDPLVFVAMGFLMTWGAYYVEVPRWSWSAAAASVPIGFLVVSILNMNNLRDYPDDLAVDKRTVPVRFGQSFGRRYQVALVLGAYVVASVFALVGLLPLLALGVWITLPLALKIVHTSLFATERKAFMAGMRDISRLHLLFGATLAACVAVAALLRAAH